jgi:hypothetical protein
VRERFVDALSCIDQRFIADDMLEQLPTASRVGKTIVVGLQPTDLIRGGIDLNKTRTHKVVEAVIPLSHQRLHRRRCRRSGRRPR